MLGSLGDVMVLVLRALEETQTRSTVLLTLGCKPFARTALTGMEDRKEREVQGKEWVPFPLAL